MNQITAPLEIERYRAQMLRDRIAENEAIYGPGCRPELRERLADHEATIARMTQTTDQTTRYEIVRDEFTVPCDHPMCDRFHQRFMYDAGNGVRWHDKKRVNWLIIDTTTDQRAFDGDMYETKRAAKAALARYLKRAQS